MSQDNYNIVAQNRKARHNYTIEAEIEAGIVLKGTEVKSLRTGKANIAESHADINNGEAFIYNLHINEYKHGNRNNHDPNRVKKLLLNGAELNKLTGKIKEKGYTLVPLSLYFNHKNIAKLKLGLAKGKKLHDKREDIKKRDWERKKARVLRGE